MFILERATGLKFCEVMVSSLVGNEQADLVLPDKEYSNGCKDIVEKIMQYINEHPGEIETNDLQLVVALPETKDRLKIVLKFTGENMTETAYDLLKKGTLASVLTYVSSQYEGEYDQTRTFLENLCCESISEYNASNPL